MYVRSLVIVPQVPEAVCVHLSVGFPSVIQIGYFLLFCILVHWFFSLSPPFWCCAHLLFLCFGSYIFSVLKFSFVSSVHIIFLHSDFLFFHWDTQLWGWKSQLPSLILSWWGCRDTSLHLSESTLRLCWHDGWWPQFFLWYLAGKDLLSF